MTNIAGPEVLSMVRFIFASCCLLPFIDTQELKKNSRESLVFLFIASFFGIFLYNYLFFIAVNHTSAVNISLVNATIPVLTLLIGSLISLKLPSIKQSAAFILSGIGIGAVMTKGQFDSTILINGFGDLVMLVAAISWVIYGFLIKRLMTVLSPLFVTFLAGFFGCIQFLILGVYTHHLPVFFSLTITQWIALSYLGIFGAALTFWLYADIIKYVGPRKTNLYIFSLVPIVSMIISYFLLGTIINLWQILGCFCVLLALWIND